MSAAPGGHGDTALLNRAPQLLPDGFTPVDAAPDDARLEVDVLDGAAFLGRADEIEALYARVYGRALHLLDHRDPPLRERMARAAARPGFEATLARLHSTAVGFVYGYPLPPDTGWWEGLAPACAEAAEPGFTRERPGRTFALCEGLVDETYRELHAGTAMYAALLVRRTEERATGLVAHTNTLMLDLARTHGWTHAGDLVPHPGWRPHLSFVLDLTPLHRSRA